MKDNGSKPAEENVCVLCGSPDRDKKSDHLRECYKTTQDKLDVGMFHPHLTQDEMGALQRGFNPICSNRKKCFQRQLSKS
jgi:hypothetical protein